MGCLVKLINPLITSVEQFIRYLLSGAAIYAVYLLSIVNYEKHLLKIIENPVIAIVGISIIGFICFSLYRAVVWIIIDFPFNWLGLSVMTIEKNQSLSNNNRMIVLLSNYILWRKSKNVRKKLSEYLYYRWSIVHFNMIVSIALWHAVFNKDENSIVDQWILYTWVLCGLLTFTAILNLYVMCGVERKIYNNPMINPHAAND